MLVILSILSQIVLNSNHLPIITTMSQFLKIPDKTSPTYYTTPHLRFPSIYFTVSSIPKTLYKDVFQPTIPMCERSWQPLRKPPSGTFQSTLPVWGATEIQLYFKFSRQISIHAPRVGSDLLWMHCSISLSYFQPRSPGGERPVSVANLPAIL